MRKLPRQLTYELVDELTSRMSDADAAEHLGMSMVPFWNARKKFNIKSYFERTGIRTRKATGEAYRFHQYDERFFQSIDTPEKAYFLGLLASDGNISPRLTAVRIALKAVDQDILECFRKHLGSDAPAIKDKISKIKGIECAPQKILALSRIAMVEDLFRWGITTNKSLTLKIRCEALKDKHLCASFIRGVWDGDGSVTERRFKVTTGSADFALQLQEMVFLVSQHRLPIKTEIGESGNPLHSLVGYIQDARALHAIYASPYPSLERKRKAYELYWEPRR
jgi:hypothetical protein